MMLFFQVVLASSSTFYIVLIYVGLSPRSLIILAPCSNSFFLCCMYVFLVLLCCFLIGTLARWLVRMGWSFAFTIWTILHFLRNHFHHDFPNPLRESVKSGTGGSKVSCSQYKDRKTIRTPSQLRSPLPFPPLPLTQPSGTVLCPRRFAQRDMRVQG